MTEAPQPTRRERRAAARKAQILDAAVQVFKDKGFHRATTREIAEAADVAEGTIYNYFDSKDDLLLTLVRELSQLDERPAMYRAGLGQDAATFFKNYLTQRLDDMGEKYALWLAVLPEILSSPDLRNRYYESFIKPAMDQITAHVGDRVEHGDLPPDTDGVALSRAATALILGMQMLLVMDDTEMAAIWQDRERLVQVITSFMAEGFLGAARREE